MTNAGARSNVKHSSGTINLSGLLTIVFVILKLTGVIAWSWWWVLSPLWIGLAFGVILLIAGIAIAGVAAVGVVSGDAYLEARQTLSVNSPSPHALTTTYDIARYYID